LGQSLRTIDPAPVRALSKADCTCCLHSCWLLMSQPDVSIQGRWFKLPPRRDLALSLPCRSWWSPAGPSRVNVNGGFLTVRRFSGFNGTEGIGWLKGRLSGAATHPAGARPSKCIIIIIAAWPTWQSTLKSGWQMPNW
jgi:hypothetical protein